MISVAEVLSLAQLQGRGGAASPSHHTLNPLLYPFPSVEPQTTQLIFSTKLKCCLWALKVKTLTIF